MPQKRLFVPLLFSLGLLPFLLHAIEVRETPPPPVKTAEPSVFLTQYLQLINNPRYAFGPLGKWKEGEIEVIIDPVQIKRIENQTRLRMISNGVKDKDAEQWSSVGIVAEDYYWIWVRDAVTFPSGVYGTYDRLIWRAGLEGPPGAAIFPLLPNKKIIVNINYRHATRSWEVELPRGLKKNGETLEQAATRELVEETGYHLSKCTLLGNLAPDSGVLTSIIPVYCGEVSYSGDSYKKYSEAIATNPSFTKEEIKQGFGRGYIEVPINGQIVKAQCRDPYLAYAILQAEVKGIL
ncbi:MAG: NUDIX hydrolase [Chlamydiota bacterium]